MTTGADVVAWARTQLEVRWMHQGRMPDVALDCAGLAVCAARALSLVAPDFDLNGYSRYPDGSMLAWCDRYMTRISALELGAVLALTTEREPQHIAIVADYVHGGWSIVHATNAAKPPRVVEHRLMPALNMRLSGIYRLPGVT